MSNLDHMEERIARLMETEIAQAIARAGLSMREAVQALTAMSASINSFHAQLGEIKKNQSIIPIPIRKMRKLYGARRREEIPQTNEIASVPVRLLKP